MDKSISSAYKNALSKIESIASNSKLQLLVVSKKRSIEQILEVYNEGHRDFGENYAKELVEKSEQLPKDIRWYLIGHLQSNKIKKLLAIENLYAIESIDSFKLAEELNNQCIKCGRESFQIFLQVNISNEASKSGAMIEDIEGLYSEIREKCQKLKISGIMSLGTIGCKEEFLKMNKIKQTICEKFEVPFDEFLCSYGTSDDFEEAINSGTNQVRLGGIIFD